MKQSQRGRYLETIVNKTIDFYNTSDLAVFTRKETPLKVLQNSELRNVKYVSKAIFSSKSTVDYYGLYKGVHVEIECKETWEKKCFPLSNIKEHQLLYLNKVNAHGGKAFLLIYSHEKNLFFWLNAERINEEKTKQMKNISFNKMEKVGTVLNIEYPGIINFIKLL